MLSTILVPLDGSPLAEFAMPYAERIATTASARLILTRVIPPFILQRPEDDLAAADEARSYLGSVAERLHAAGLVAETCAPWGQPAVEIVDQIRSRGVDLVVVATHGRSGLGRWLYGSVADEVLRHAPVPVFLVPAGVAQPWPTERQPRIFVPLDGSELAEAVLGPVQEFAVRLGAEIVLFQAIPLPPQDVYAGLGAYLTFDPEAELAAAQRYLGDVAARLRPALASVRIRTELGQAPVVIAQVAAAEKTDVIAMATHGRSGLGRLVLGSVATGTLQRSTVPLLLVRPSVPSPPAPPTTGVVTAAHG